MEFRKYNSLENTYLKEELDRIITTGNHLGEFVVQEKVHGANFSIWYDEKTFKIAKRSGFVEEDEDFYGAQKVLEKYQNQVEQLYKMLNGEDKKENTTEIDENNANETSLAIFGELFGGSYPHESVARVKNVQRIQSGVFYSPDIDFYVYDICVNGSFLSVDRCNELFAKNGFFYAKTLFRGTFEDALKYPNEFLTTIPFWLDLPEMSDPTTPNICEGVVIKPISAKYLPNGSRIILKNKNEKWSEKKKSTSSNASKAEIQLSDEGKVLFDELLSLITENRLKNVISKIGKVENKDFGKIMGFLSLDAYEDFCKSFSTPFAELEKEEQKKIKKQMNNEASKLVKTCFRQILEGNF